MRKYNWNDIPEEIIIVITSYIDYNDISALSCTNRTFYNIFDKIITWNILLKYNYKDQKENKPNNIKSKEWYKMLDTMMIISAHIEDFEGHIRCKNQSRSRAQFC
jgi:hypothetical protein